MEWAKHVHIFSSPLRGEDQGGGDRATYSYLALCSLTPTLTSPLKGEEKKGYGT